MKFLKKVISWFRKLTKKVRKALPIAVMVVQGIKQAIDNGTVDFLADIVKKIIPTGTDDAVIDIAIKYAKKHIPVLCIKLEILNASNIANGDVELLTHALNALKETQGEKWEQFTSGMAGEILTFLADGKIDGVEATILAKGYYDKYIKK